MVVWEDAISLQHAILFNLIQRVECMESMSGASANTAVRRASRVGEISAPELQWRRTRRLTARAAEAATAGDHGELDQRQVAAVRSIAEVHTGKARATPGKRYTVRETGRRITPSHVASIRGVRHRLNEFLPRSFDAACPSDRWHDTTDFKRAKNRDDHPCIACSLICAMVSSRMVINTTCTCVSIRRVPHPPTNSYSL